MRKMWAGRFREPQDPRFERWQRSLPFDRRLLSEELAASRAYARALKKAGVLSATELETLLEGLDQVARKASEDPEWIEGSQAEDVHHFVESELMSRVGEVGAKLHTGRSRNEQIATDLRLFTRTAIDGVQERAANLVQTLLARAEELGQTPMPAYTHLQPAQPVLAAHWLLAYVEMFFRDMERLGDCRKRANTLPLGSGAVAGTTVPLDRTALAQELAFDRISANSMDATSDRDFALELLHVLSQIALHLSRWAEDLILFSSTEFAFVRLPESFSTGSSAMPQKKNPDALELIRGQTARVLASALTVSVLLKGLPLAYNKDLQESQEPLFAASDTILEALEIAAGFMAALEFDTDRMRAAANSPFLNATAAADYLARRGVPFRRAHAVIGQIVQFCLKEGRTLESLSLEELKKFDSTFQQDFFDCLPTGAVVARHDVCGGTAPSQVRRAMQAARQRLDTLQAKQRAADLKSQER